ncbi:Uncharacterised protein [BD1-7 clade bacterium]|uniref:DUF4124 domain-containing protein n=1 Tax=BD1-7 clade bacterium TaxID=2029982 RepID=A0A5S9Q863_9GAMM|nr:Uncharacterised protein [BD1-7 clade bacterium]CAA0115156.1 Uncharacterised protein [BD1-7 clade bacterium]
MATMRLFSLLLLLILSTTTVQAAKFYKWVDTDGQTHYGERPPAGVDTEEVRTYGDKATSRPTSSLPSLPTTAPTEQQAPEAVQAKKDPETCRKARENYRIMSTKPLVLDPDGNIMTIEAKNKELKRSQKIIDIHCD